MTSKYACDICKNIKCWLCKGNVYYDRVMELNTHAVQEHKQDIKLFREFVKLNGCVSHTDFKTPVEEFIKIISDRIAELKNMLHENPHDCTTLALLGENQAIWAQLTLLLENKL